MPRMPFADRADRHRPTRHKLSAARRRGWPAAGLWMLLALSGTTCCAAAPTGPEAGDSVLITADLGRCGREDAVLFIVLWQGVMGVATEPLLLGWNKPRVGEVWRGDFRDEGLIEAVNPQRGETSWLSIEQTGLPVGDQDRLMRAFCRR